MSAIVYAPRGDCWDKVREQLCDIDPQDVRVTWIPLAAWRRHHHRPNSRQKLPSQLCCSRGGQHQQQ